GKGGFDFSFLNSLEILPLEIHARFGIDKWNNNRNFFAIGFQVRNIPITLGVADIWEAGGIVTSNMVVEKDPAHQDRFAFSNAGNMGKFIEEMPVHRGNGSTFAAGLRGRMVITKIAVVDNLYFGFTNGPVVEAGGDLYLALGLEALFGGAIDERGTKLGGCVGLGDVLLRYHHPNRHFSCNLAMSTEVMGIMLTGNVGFEASPSLFRVYVGYPDALAGEFGVNLGFVSGKGRVEYGAEYQIGGEHGAHAKIKQRLESEAKVDLGVIYVKTSSYIGGEGIAILLPPTVSLEVCLGGKIVGGIRFFGTHDVIRLSLDAMGRMTVVFSDPSWRLEAKCTVGYGINLGFVGSISGSKTVHLDKKISL
ncbi:MAG: hypothetical protein FWG28_03060, partial [Clostridiales bacterium]|nr:hypothetical protein [Clostridiales bacterium]